MHIPKTLASKPRIWLKPRLIKAPVGCKVADATGLQSHMQPVEYHLRPIRGRPRGSKTGGGKQNVSPNSSDVSDVMQLSESPTQATPLDLVDSTTKKPKKTRAKHKNVVQPNPYPDLSKYRSSGEQSTCADDAIPPFPMPTTSNTDSAVNTTSMHSIGSPPMIHYPLPVSDDPAFFLLTNAEWNNVSPPSSTRPYVQPHHYNENYDHTLRPPDETAVTDQSQIYPVPTPRNAASTSSTGSTGALRRKRKRDADDNEPHEARSSLRQRPMNTPSSSLSELCDHRAGVTSSTSARRIYEYPNPSRDGRTSLADTYHNSGGNFETTDIATLSPIINT